MNWFHAGVEVDEGKDVLLHLDHVAALTRHEINRAGGRIVQVEVVLVTGHDFTFEGDTAERLWHRLHQPHSHKNGRRLTP